MKRNDYQQVTEIRTTKDCFLWLAFVSCDFCYFVTILLFCPFFAFFGITFVTLKISNHHSSLSDNGFHKSKTWQMVTLNFCL